ncbi:MAG: ATP cone domain-containing protein, partial [Planctomycetes bacterium]|nr:ATP cone domain-containing protein [Planctomycetota bacterium]
MKEREERPRPEAPETIEKRDGRRVPFDRARIESAVSRAQAAVGEDDPSFAREIAELVEYSLTRRHAAAVHEGTPGIEEIQDLVERALIELGRAPVAKAYILYRDRRARARALDPTPKERERASSVSVADADGVERWDRSRVAQALVDEAGLGRER